MTSVGKQSQRVREEAKQHLSYYIDNVKSYTNRKGLTESRWQMMRMPPVGMGMVVVRVYVRIFPSQIADSNYPCSLKLEVRRYAVPRLLLPVHTAKAEIFHLDILVDTVMGTFSSDPGLLHATERSNLVGN